MTYQAIDIAHFIISTCNFKELPVSNLKLQKMLYFLWVDYFKKTQEELFTDAIYAWKFGPVVPDIYYEYCVYGGLPIRLKYKTNISANDQIILQEILKPYMSMPTATLVGLTHEPNTPWSIIFQHGSGNRSIIPFELIKEKTNGDW